MNFLYQIGEMTDGNNRPVTDRAFIEIVEAHDPQIILGEINIEIADAAEHARLIAAAPRLLEALKLFTSPSMGETRTMLGESSIGWQQSDGLTASERVAMARAAVAEATMVKL
jgi:hypothetical protein